MQPTGSQPTSSMFRRGLILAALVALVAWSAGRQEITSAPFTDRAEVAASLQGEELPAFVPGLVLWLDAADADTLFADPAGTVPASGTDAVARWVDKSSLGNDAQQVSAGARPTLAARGGQAVPVFDGADQLVLDPARLPQGTTDSTTFVVAERDTGAGLQGVLSHGGAGGGAIRWVGASTGNTYLSANGAANPTSAAWPSGAAGLVTAGFQGGASGTIRQRGGDEATVAGSYTTGSTFATVGSGNLNQYWNGPIHEVVVYGRALSDQERRSVELHLAAKWDLDLAPVAPTGLSAQATAAGTVTAAWTAPADDGGSPVTDYTVRYRQQGSSTWLTLADGTSTATTATVTGLTTGATYEVQVAARNAIGRGSWSATATAGAMAAWTPADLPGGVALWFDASDPGAVVTVGGAVAELRDRSGNGRHAVQTTAGLRPALSTGVLGGRTAMVFDGGDDRLPFDGSFLAMTDYTAAAAVARTSSAGGNYFLGGGGSPNSALILGWRHDTTVTHAQYGNDYDMTVPAFTTPTGTLMVSRHAAATGKATWLDGSLARSVANTTPLSTWSGAAVGRYGAASFAGRVGEIVISTNALTSTDRERLEGYLAHRWGTAASLPASHPFRSTPPLTATPATAPVAPTGLVAVPGDGEVRLTWTAPASDGGSPIRDYVVERATDAGFTTSVTVADGLSTATTATVAGLPNGTAQWFRIRAVNAAGSSPTVATSDGATPRAYHEAVLADAPVAWWRLGEPSGTIAHSEAGTGLTGTAIGSPTSITDDPLLGSADRARRFAGNRYEIPNVSATQTSEGTLEAWIRTTAPGSWFRGLVVKPLAYGLFLRDGEFGTYDWGAATWRSTGISLTDGQWHHVAMTYRSGVTNGTVLYVDGAPVLTTTLTVGNQSEGFRIADNIGQPFTGDVDEAAFYGTVLSPARIAAHHRAGVTGANDGIAPAVPTGLTATPGAAEVALSWTAVADADVAGYRVYRDGTLVRQQAGTSFTDTGLVNGTTYAYSVEAYDARGNRSALSTSVAATPVAPPGVVTSLTATAGGGAVALAWGAAPDNGSPITDYVVEQRTGGGSWTTVGDGVSATTGAAVTGLTAGTTYEFRVSAVNAVGAGSAATTNATSQALWTPADISGGLAAWFDASDPSTLTASDAAVSEWRDRSGSSRHLSTSGTARPTASTLTPGGRGTLEFDGNDWMASALPVDLTTGATVYVAGRNDLRKDYNGLVRVAPTLDAQESRFEFYWQAGSGGSGNLVTAANRAGNFRFEAADNAGPNPGSWYVVGTVIDPGSPTNASQFVQGSAAPDSQTWSSGSLVPSGAQTLWIGSGYGSPTGKLDGALGEIVVAATPLSSTDRQRLEGYLAHRWGAVATLPSNHPFRLVPPGVATEATVPSTPTGLRAVPGDGDVLLSWTAPANGGTAIRDYVIERSTDAGFTAPVAIADGVSTTTSFTVTGLANGTAQWFRVRAVNAAGTGTAATASATPNAYREAVLADGPVGYWRLGEVSGTIAYSEVGGATLHGIRSGTTATLAGAPSATADPAGSFDGTSQSITIADQPAIRVTGSQTIEMWLRPTAFDARRNPWSQSYSAEGTITQESGGSVNYYYGPSGLNGATYSSIGLPAGNLALNQWQHVVVVRDMTTRKMRWYVNGTERAVGDVAYPTITASGGTVQIGAGYVSRYLGGIDEVALYDTALSPARIAAHHRAGITGTNDGIAPAVPTGLVATGGNAQVALSWNAVADADLVGYRVFRDGTLVRQQLGTTFTDAGLTNGTTYSYTVEAYDTRGNRSAGVTATAAPRVEPGAPTALTATPNGDRSIGLSWTAPTVLGEPPLTDYRVEVRPQGGSWTVVADGVSTATTATVTGLTAGTTYEFQVTALYDLGEGTPSAVASAQALSLWTPADIPGGLALWLDASDPTSLSLDGGSVTAWRDRSGRSRHAVQTDPARRPTFTAGDPRAGGRPTVSAPTGAGLIGLDLPSFAMHRFVGVIGYRSGTETTFAGYSTLLAGSGSWGVPRLGMGNSGTSTWFGSETLTSTSFSNGAASASATALPMPLGIQRFDLPASTTSPWTLGYNAATADRNWFGPISEVVAFEDLALSADDLERLEGYLAHRWGTEARLPVGHPYRSVPPLTLAPAAPPAAPTSLLLTPASGQVALNWTAPVVSGTPIRDYVIEHRPSGGSWTNFADGVSTTTSATVTGLAAGASHEFRVAAVTAAGIGAWASASTTLGTLWTPAHLAGGAVVWFDASNTGSFTESGGAVSEWRDLSGNARHASQATGSLQPVRVPDAAGLPAGRAAVRFDGTDDLLVGPNSLTAGPATVAFVAKDGGTSSNVGGVWSTGSLGVWSNTGSNYVVDGGGASTTNSSNTTSSITSWRTITAQYTSAGTSGSSIWLDGNLEEAYAGSGVGTQTQATFEIGGRTVGNLTSRVFRGDIAEIVVAASAIPEADRQRIEGYLAHRYGLTAGLPAGHPYKNAPPMLDAPTGLTATAAPDAVHLAWTAAPQRGGATPTDYTVHYRAQGASAWTTFPDGVSTATTASVTGLTGTTTYEFRVGAVYPAGAGSWSTSASATVVPWTPADLAGVAAWYDAADAGSVTLNGSAVSEWRDRSINNRHVAQPTAAKQPTYTTSGALQNGRNVLTFDGNQRSLFASSSVLNLTPPFTRFIAARFEGKANQSVLIDSDTTSNQAVFYNGENGSSWVAAQGIAPNFANFAYGTRDFLDHLHVHVINGASSSWGLDGSAMTGPLNPGPSGMPGIRIGHVRTELHPQYAFQGRIYEIVLVSGIVSDADRQRVEGYLAHKWGLTANLPAGHPYKAAPPTA